MDGVLGQQAGVWVPIPISKINKLHVKFQKVLGEEEEGKKKLNPF